MKETIVNSFSDLDLIFDKHPKGSMFRGVSKSSYELIPSLYRNPAIKNINDFDRREEGMMWLFKTHAKAHLTYLPSNDIGWLTIAQHHGMPTRLLDWTLSPLVALFFATIKDENSDGAIYSNDLPKFEKEEDIDIKILSSITSFIPAHATKRITAQSGLFTVHPTCKIKLENDDILKILIPKKLKYDFLEKSVKFGIHHSTLFPDLDGLTSYIKYLYDYK